MVNILLSSIAVLQQMTAMEKIFISKTKGKYDERLCWCTCVEPYVIPCVFHLHSDEGRRQCSFAGLCMKS